MGDYDPEKTIGVILGRFQIPSIPKDKMNIFDEVLSWGLKKNIVVLGVPPSAIKATKNNPLDFDARRRMIEETYPGEFQIFYLKDEKLDEIWSSKLDDLISSAIDGEDLTPVIFGTKESLSKYCGSYNVFFYERPKFVSNESVMRELAGKKIISGEAWRAGAIWSSQNRYDQVCTTVDCLILDGDEVWMCRKPNEDKLRFVGGFADPNKDKSFEDAAVREAYEETSLKCNEVEYICSKFINDWRFANETDKIITIFYAMNRVSGLPKASDDVSEIQRVQIMHLSTDDVVEEHRQLLIEAQNWYKEVVLGKVE